MFRFHSVTCGYPGFPAPLVQSVSCSVTPCSFWPYGLYRPPGSSVHGILQVRILEWVAIPLPEVFLTQGSHPGLVRCRQILYRLSQRLFFFSIVYPHLLCHRLTDGECVGLLPGFLSCSWIFTKKGYISFLWNFRNLPLALGELTVHRTKVWAPMWYNWWVELVSVAIQKLRCLIALSVFVELIFYGCEIFSQWQ